MSAARPCPACHAGDSAVRGEVGGFVMHSCARCGTLFTAVIPSQGSAEDYDSYYGEANLTVPPFIAVRLDEVVAGFAPARRNGRLLDVGFGAGSLLQAAARGGWEAHGTEVSAPAVEHARSLGLQVVQGELADARYPAGHFDVVTAVEVLEHLPDPASLLREVKRILRPGGLFWATTPHGVGISARLLGTRWSVVSPPEHLQLFSRGGMERLLKEVGFGKVSIAAHGTNPFEIVNALRSRGGREDSFNRVATSYKLNAFLTEKPSRRFIKAALNGLFGATRTGDSLKIRAFS